MDVRVNLVDSTLGATYLSGSGQLILTTSSVNSHVVLALSGLNLRLHSLVAGKGLIALLSTHNTLVEQALNTIVRLLSNLKTSLGLL